ncbi:MAG: CheR family methyltransferase [bacterium]
MVIQARMMNNDLYKYRAYLKIIEENTGYDFSGYSLESVNAKLRNFISLECIGSAEDLKEKVDSNKTFQNRLLENLLVGYTEMFRDPGFYSSLRQNVLPNLSTFNNICIWHAGCATGEEAYSLAILLEELNLLERCEIYATDINESHLKNATRGIYPLASMQESTARYYKSGGKKNLSNYYTAYYDHIIFHHHLRDHIKFVLHDMVEDKPLKQFHLILCRNVFIYFNNGLQQNVLQSLLNSLTNYGYFGMGVKEQFVDTTKFDLTVIDNQMKIFRKVSKL